MLAKTCVANGAFLAAPTLPPQRTLFRRRGGPECKVCAADGASEAWEDLSGGRGTCLKRTLRPGRSEDGLPPVGARVTVHYSMHIEGALVDSSRERDAPFQFFLGRWPSEAMFGWDKALATMQMGEVAAVRCGPRYAYGERGAPPKIPPNATIDCELELLDWVDFAARYNAAPGENESERLARWKQEVAEGTSPIREEAGVDAQVQAATVDATPVAQAPLKGVATRSANAPSAGARQTVSREGAAAGSNGGEVGTAAAPSSPAASATSGVEMRPGSGSSSGASRQKVIINPDTTEGRRALQRQRLQGYADRFRWREDGKSIDVYIPVQDGTRAAHVSCEIRTRFLSVKVVKCDKSGPDHTISDFEPLEGELEGAIRPDGSIWLLTDLALAPASFGPGSGAARVTPGAMEGGETCVHVHLEKRPPDDLVWARLFKRSEEEEAQEEAEANRLRGQARALRAGRPPTRPPRETLQ